ncbi:phosphoribosyltransferase [Salegentibacter sediminis]|uniref:phosphoribosyltransferase n=1 Tax=Salegentibacter sediminis TaxID=1930251 RepID=UPI0009BF0619|nr:phosphoribosyltransferase family protein [Salegentibacter sediminis]
MFTDRIDAGEQLSRELADYKGKPVVVLAIPRGGLPIGAILAKSLEAPLDVVLSKKIGHPYNSEFAIGAVSLEDITLSPTEHFSEEYISTQTEKIRELLRKRDREYHKNSSPVNLKDKIIIITDDGIATGNTLLSTVMLVHKQKPREIIVAIPVAPPSSVEKLKNSPEISKVICLETPFNFSAVGQFYEDFRAVSDKEAIEILHETNREYGKPKG